MQFKTDPRLPLSFAVCLIMMLFIIIDSGENVLKLGFVGIIGLLGMIASKVFDK